MATYNSATTKLIFGQADVKFGAASLPLLASAVTFTAEPQYTDITVYDFGQSPVDRIVTGWNVTVSTAIAEESLDAIKLSVPVTEQVDGTTPTKKNLVDSAVGLSLRSKGAELVIHPRSAGSSLDQDITVFCAVPSGNFERVYGLEQGQIAVSFMGLVKDGAEAGKAGNYFQYGPDVVPAP